MSDLFVYKLLKIVFFLVGMFPRRALSFFSDLLGLIWFKVDKRHRDIVFENIGFAYPSSLSRTQAELMAKRIFKNIASIPFEVIWFHQKPPEVLFNHITIKGKHHFEKAQKRGKGQIILSGHLGNFEFLMPAMIKAGAQGYAIYRKMDVQALERLVKEVRERTGAQMIPTGGLARKLDALLKANRAIGCLLDQNAAPYNGVFTDYFNRRACTNNSLAKVILRTDASVVPVFIMRKGGQYFLEFFEELPVERTGCPIKDLEKNTQNYVTAIEKMVRKCPEQYFWVHNRWKTKPFTLIPRIPDRAGVKS